MRLLLSCQTPTSRDLPRHAEAARHFSRGRRDKKNDSERFNLFQGKPSSRESIITPVKRVLYSHTLPHSQQTAKMVEKVYVTYNDVCPPEQPYNPSTGTCFVLDREVNKRSY
jgi:hypothetical protein